MSRTMLFYEQVAPVSLERHREWSVEGGSDFAFSRSTNAVPLTAVEFARAGREYPIVFAGEEELAPVAVLGIEDRQNLYIDDEGRWSGEYIPAFVRRYPFVFATGGEGGTFTVCIDEGFAGCNREGRGERLFDEAGERTPYLERVVAFLSEYQRQYQVTRDFCARIAELDLLEPVQANVALNTGRKVSLGGFRVVSRARLKELPAETLKDLAGNDYLELVYQHLVSLAAFAGMVDRLAKHDASAA